MTGPHRRQVAVDGGDLAVWWWGSGVDEQRAPVAVAAHGITASHRAWAAVADRVAGDVTLIAPDLRGRGDSAAVAGPTSMERHARDLAAVLDDARVDAAVVAGHSMGGFVAATFATLFPERTRAVVMVDGGPPLAAPLPPDADVAAVLAAIVGPAVARLQQRFGSREEYRSFWHHHPALRDSGVDPAVIDAYADHDLHGPPGDLRSKASADRVREDARDTLTSAAVASAVARLGVPAVLLLAERGMLDDETPLYPPASVADLETAGGPLEVIRVRDTNHYTIMLGATGARAVASQVRRFAGADTATG